MRLLADQDVYASTVRFLQDSGHDVLRAAEIGLAQATDAELLSAAAEQGRVLLTRDRDFGALVFVARLGKGVCYLRLTPSSQASVHRELAKVLSAYDEKVLADAFVVVEPGRHRFRRLSP